MAIRQNSPMAQALRTAQQFPDPSQAFKDKQLSFIRQMLEKINRLTAQSLDKDVAAPQFVLVSPNGTAYKVTVSNTGVLTTVVARGS